VQSRQLKPATESALRALPVEAKRRVLAEAPPAGSALASRHDELVLELVRREEKLQEKPSQAESSPETDVAALLKGFAEENQLRADVVQRLNSLSNDQLRTVIGARGSSSFQLRKEGRDANAVVLEKVRRAISEASSKESKELSPLQKKIKEKIEARAHSLDFAQDVMEFVHKHDLAKESEQALMMLPQVKVMEIIKNKHLFKAMNAQEKFDALLAKVKRADESAFELIKKLSKGSSQRPEEKKPEAKRSEAKPANRSWSRRRSKSRKRSPSRERHRKSRSRRRRSYGRRDGRRRSLPRSPVRKKSPLRRKAKTKTKTQGHRRSRSRSRSRSRKRRQARRSSSGSSKSSSSSSSGKSAPAKKRPRAAKQAPSEQEPPRSPARAAPDAVKSLSSRIAELTSSKVLSSLASLEAVSRADPPEPVFEDSAAAEPLPEEAARDDEAQAPEPPPEEAACDDEAQAPEPEGAAVEAEAAAGPSASSSLVVRPGGDSEQRVWEWLESLDGGRGSMLQYFEAVKNEFDADFSQLAAARLAQPIAAGTLGCIEPSFFEVLDVKSVGHRLLFAKGLLALG